MKQAGTIIPEAVIRAVSGRPSVGQWEPIFQLLTRDADGHPHVCLLSRAEVRAWPDRLALVVSSSSVKADLHRDGRATLCVYTPDSVVYCGVELASAGESGPWTLYDGRVRAVRIDGMNVALTPPRFLATAEIMANENWAACDELLERASRSR